MTETLPRGDSLASPPLSPVAFGPAGLTTARGAALYIGALLGPGLLLLPGLAVLLPLFLAAAAAEWPAGWRDARALRAPGSASCPREP